MFQIMKTQKRATVYFDPELHRALRLRAVANDRSISEIVNEAVGWRWPKTRRISKRSIYGFASAAFHSRLCSRI
jgi:hypothetical protein